MPLSRFLVLVTLAAALTTTACASRRGAAPVGHMAGPASSASVGAPGSTSAAPDDFASLDPAQRAALVRDFEQTAGERVFFALDSHDLSAQARATLEAQAAWLGRQPGLRVLVAGHADERGTREYNLGLGARRANAARTYLISLGVSPERLETVSYGKERPLDPRSSEAGWARNRNAHSVLVQLVGNL